MIKEGKASRTVFPDGTVGVYFRINEELYEKFCKKCEVNGFKKKRKLEQIIEKFTK